MRGVLHDAMRKRTDTYNDAKRHLDLTRDVETAEAMYVATCARISALETIAVNKLMSEALKLLETELGRALRLWDIREMSRKAAAEEWE